MAWRTCERNRARGGWRELLLLAAALGGAAGFADEALVLRLDPGQPGPEIPRTFVGVFFEDINHGADGGLSAERLINRGFEFPQPLQGWRLEAGCAAEVRTDGAMVAKAPHYVRLRSVQGGGVLENQGFSGMGVRKGEQYWLTLQLRLAGPEPVVLRVELVAPDQRVLASRRVKAMKGEWRRVSISLRSRATEAKARLRLRLENAGALDLDQLSLMPEESLKGRLPRFRRDLVRMLQDMKPGFVRFPGGCIVEGRHLPLRYQWKSTLGERDERQVLINRWNDEFKHRPAPEYYQTFDMGFHEYFLLCEALGAAPLPVLNCGMACQFNSGELVPLGELEPYVQDALDLIEYAKGPVTSPWGARRAAAGHPRPFPLRYLGIGNEQWGPAYVERFERFAKALKLRYPEIQLVASAGPGPADDRFKFAWEKLPGRGADIMDEHCYAAPQWFLDSATRYDGYDRRGPKVFMGEYAAQSVGVAKPENRNNWECALAEAAFLTGLERNADVVSMTSYAPLFGHVDAWQWTPNLIWFDNLDVFGTPSYYVQQLFSLHRGQRMVRATVDGRPVAGQQGLYVSASLDGRGQELILKVVNTSAQPREVRLAVEGPVRLGSDDNVLELSAPGLQAENSLGQPRLVAPQERRAALGADSLLQVPGHSVAAHRISLRRR